MANDEDMKEKVYQIANDMRLGSFYVDQLLEQCNGSFLCVLNKLLAMQQASLDESRKSLISDITSEENIEQSDKAKRMIQDFVEKIHKSQHGKNEQSYK